jgi:hypothetical protein
MQEWRKSLRDSAGSFVHFLGEQPSVLFVIHRSVKARGAFPKGGGHFLGVAGLCERGVGGGECTPIAAIALKN